MIRKGPQKQTKPEKKSQPTQVPYETVIGPSNKNRITLSSMISNPAPRKNPSTILNLQQQSTMQSKQAFIKQLQQSIMDKKQKNDAIQQAFRRRQQFTHFFDKTQHPEQRLQSLTQGCALAAAHNPHFKRALLHTLLLSLKQWQSNRAKAAKTLLIWLISWASRLFTLLGRNLTSA